MPARRTCVRLGLVGLVALLVAGCGRDTASTATTPASVQVVDIGEGLQGPEGTTATRTAEGLEHVAALAVDGEGRIWASTAAFDYDGTDGVYVITESGAQPVQVISEVRTPLGLLWIGDTLYVASFERVDAYSGFDGARFTTQQEVVAFPAGVGEVNGLAASATGRIVVGISSPCDACVPSSELSGAVVSFLPDGSDLRVEARNIRAPIGLAYYPATDDLFVSMNQQDGLGDATPGDWLALVESGQDWKSPTCYGQAGAVCEGVPEPVAVLDAHAAVSGVAIVTGRMGSSVGDAALVAEWAAGKVMLVALEPNGDSYSSTVSTFVSGLQSPVPVITTTDGAVLIGDWGTGTVYRIAT